MLEVSSVLEVSSALDDGVVVIDSPVLFTVGCVDILQTEQCIVSVLLLSILPNLVSSYQLFNLCEYQTLSTARQ